MGQTKINISISNFLMFTLVMVTMGILLKSDYGILGEKSQDIIILSTFLLASWRN